MFLIDMHLVVENVIDAQYTAVILIKYLNFTSIVRRTDVRDWDDAYLRSHSFTQYIVYTSGPSVMYGMWETEVHIHKQAAPRPSPVASCVPCGAASANSNLNSNESNNTLST